MCDQTEINYLDGDIVWVKLGSAWWPGQVTGLDNLPDVLQTQYKKKPHIAAVKFFQEDSYELVKNIQQIYQYNCRQKDDFIKKGLDKYRSRSKDGTNYMDKFPGDVETAEKLTDGDPDILSSSKFCEQKKPDISSLFGEKKLPKRKKDKDDNTNNRKSLIVDNNIRKITHPRFIGRKSDHEVRIRQQNTKIINPSTPNLNDSSSSAKTPTETPIATPTRTTPSTPSIYTCPHCDYTSTRLNVIICHNKSHRNNVTRPSVTPVRRPIPPKSRSVGAGISAVNDGEIQKRKYTRKNKSLSVKLKDDKIIDTPKRKYTKGIEKPPKKKKNDPEVKEKHLRESLLADWEDGSEDGDMDVDLDNSASDDFSSSPSKNIDKEKINNDKDIDDVDKSSSPIKNSINRIDTDAEVEKQQKSPQQRSPLLKKFKKFDDSKTNLSSSDDKNDQKSKLSCFDFDEDEEPQPALPPARKITRVFGEKNKSRKKELIKEFTRTSQAFTDEKTNEEEQDLSQVQSKEEIKKSDDDKIKDVDDDDFNDKINREINETTELVAKIAETTTDLIPSKSEMIENTEILKVNEDQEEDIEEEKEIIEQNDEKLDKVQEKNKNDTNEKLADDQIHDDDDVEDIEKTKNDIEMKKVEEKEDQVDKMDEEKEELGDEINEEKKELDDEINEEKKEQDDKTDEVMQEQVDKKDEEKEELNDRMNEEEKKQDDKIDEVMQEDVVEKNEKTDKPVIDDDQVMEINNENQNTDVELTKENENQDIDADEEEKTQDIKIDENQQIEEETKVEDDLDNNKLNLTESTIVSEPEINKVQEISDLKINETDEILQSNSEKEIINSPNKLIESGKIIIEPEKTEDMEEKIEQTEQVDQSIDTFDEEMKTKDGKLDNIEENIQESRITIEAEEEILSTSELTAATKSGTSSNIDKTLPQVNKLNTPTKTESIDNKTMTPDVPEKRRRGRPRKTPIPAHMSGNGDSLMKIEEPKTPGTPDSQDFDRKTSESDGEKSNAGRRRKPSKKYLESDLYCPSPGSRTPRTDDSQSEAEDKSLTIKKRGKRGRKPSKKSIAKSIEEYEFSDQTLDSAEESMIGEPIKIQDINEKTDTLSPVDVTDLLVNSDIEIRDNKIHDNVDDNKIDKLPPKKSQIKKFESSQYEFFESDDKEESTKIIETTTTATTVTHTEILSDNNVNEILVESKIEALQKEEEHSMEIQTETNETIIEEAIENIIVENDKKLMTEENKEAVNVVEPIKSLVENVEVSEENKSIIVDTNMSIDEEKEKIADEVVVQDNVVIVEEHVETVEEVETLPEAITETVVVEEKIEEIASSNEEVIKTTEVVEKIVETTKAIEQTSQINEEIPVKIPNVEDVVENIEDLVEDIEQVVENIEDLVENIEQAVEQAEEIAVKFEKIPVKVEEKMVQLLEQVEAMDDQTEEIVTTTPDNEPTETITTEIIETQEIPLPIIQETPKIQETIVSSPKKVEPIANKITTINQNIIETTQQKSQELIMPVKKREKPRIIENVTLKQPMQILKTKLLEKPRSQKHKLDIDMLKRNRSTPPTKIMRIDPQLIKTKSSGKTGTGQLTLSKKLEVLKADEAKNEAINEEVLGNTSGVISLATSGSQSFQNMELDINSIPFIFQEDLNSDSIKQLPDMTSTIITPSPTIQTSIQQPQQTSSLTFVQTTQPTVSTQQIKLAQKMPDNSGELSPSKKKTLSPAVMKNKPKAKPTITSVKTLMPGSLKQLKLGQSAQGKTGTVINQKGGVPGKYIILHTSNAQQMSSNKTVTPQKIPIPQNKTPNQIIHQGNKVVILTSPQSGQTKMLPLSMQKNVQQKKIIKGNQVYTQISKNQILPKTDTSSLSSSSSSSSTSSPTTSKIITGQKIISTTQGNIVTSKVFTSVPGMQKIYVQSDGTKLMTKGGQVYTTISTGGLTKMIAGQKTLVTKQGTIVGTVAGQGGSKTILSPMSQGNKQTITHNLQSSKGTVLTPITGQQVKAIAAKALPSKTQKIQFIQQQQQQQKSPILSKTQKVPMTSGTNMSGMRVVTPNRNIKNTGQVIIQNSPVTKAAVGKKIIRQNVVNQSGKSPQLLSSSSSPSGTSVQMTKTKILSSPALAIQKSANTPKGRSLKTLQNKVYIQKIQDPTSSPPTKPNISSTITKIAGSPKMTNLKTTPVKNIQKSLVSPKQQQQQQLRNISSPMASPPSTSSSNIHTIQSSPPPLQEIKQSDIEETVKVVTTASPTATTLSSQPPPLVSAVAATTMLATVATTTTTVAVAVAATAVTTTPTTAAIETNEVIVKQNTEVGVQSQTETVSAESNEQKVATSQPQILMLPTPSADGSPSYSLYVVDENGIANPMDSTALLALDGLMTNSDGSQTLSIDPNTSNFVLHIDDETQIQALSGSQIIQQPSETQIVSTNSNQDILAAALANSDFQGEISIPETSSTSVLSTDINQTNLISQTMLQSTLVSPPTERLLSSVQETSLTWDRPIMSPLEVPSNIVPTLTQNTTTDLSSSVPFDMNYTADNATIQLPGNSMPDIGEVVDSHKANDDENVTQKSTTTATATTQYSNLSNLETNETIVTTSIPSTSSVSYSVSIPDNITSGVQTTPSMPIIDDIFSDNIDEFNKKTIDNKYSSKNKNNNKTNKNNNKNKKLDKNKQVTTDVSVDKNVLLSKNNDDKLIDQQPETSQKILDMPIVGDTPIIDNKIEDKNNDDNKNLLNSDVVDSCMAAVVDNSSIITESSNDVQSTAKIIDNNNHDNDVKTDVLTTTNNQEEAETSDKKVVPSDNIESMEVDDETVYDAVEEIKQTAESSNVQEIEAMECTFNQDTVDAEQNQEIPSQSFEQFKIIDNNESPSQSVEKSTDSREPSQSEADELMEINNEPPSQSFENSALHEASQSYQENSNINSRSDQIDDPSFPTQSYDVGKIDNITENIETDCELSQEGNIPSQSNDVDIDGIGTSTFTNQGNDDETASSSYVPETPEAQERDQDQESAISTSSYEIPPSDEINIASSSLIPDTSGNEHANIHDNGVPEIPTSSYNLNPDSSSAHIDSQVPSSSFEDQIVIEQNVSTSYEVPISMPSIEDNSSSGNFVSESGDQTNEPTSYYARNPEDITSEASQSYFVRDPPSPSYNEQNVSPSYYDAPQEASQSFYSTQEIERTAEQSSSSSSSRNVEASQSFYQDNSDGLSLRQQGEATPTYYPLDNDNEPTERHDLVESSVSATRPTER